MVLEYLILWYEPMLLNLDTPDNYKYALKLFWWLVFSFIRDHIVCSGFRPSVSDSEMEDDPISHVEVPQKLPSRGNIVSQKSSIRLSELGPRLTLQVWWATGSKKPKPSLQLDIRWV